MKQSAWITGLFFAVFLFAGVFCHRDYGVALDEPIIRNYGLVVWNYLFHGDTALVTHGDRFHGPVFEFFLVAAEKLLRVSDPGAVFHLRHLLTFLFFWCGAIFFYLLCRRFFGDWRLALLGAVFLAASPRMFAHAFFNSKDMAFLSAFIMAAYTMTLFLESRRTRHLIVHAFVSAVLVDIRVMGLLVPVLTVSLMTAGHMAAGGRKERRPLLRDCALYSAAFLAFMTALWPALWGNPVMGLAKALFQMNRFPHYSDMLFFGQFYAPGHLPWYYVPGWIAVSAPLLYTALAIVGTASCFRAVIFRPKAAMTRDWHRIAVLCWFFAPWIAVLALRPVIFDEWRHLFFMYPALILLALYGVRALAGVFRSARQGWLRRSGTAAVGLLVIIGVGEPALFMIRSHPYEYVYFNRLAGGVRGALDNFDLDYWGVAYRGVYEQIASNDARPAIGIHAANTFGLLNAETLGKKERSRLRYEEAALADYIVTNFRWVKRSAYAGGKPAYTVCVDGVPIAAAYAKE